jgi:hypothetical protein
MKVYEIVTEADNVIPFPGKGTVPKNGANAFGQMANQLGSGTSSSGGTTTQTPSGSVHTSNPNNPNNPAKPSASNTAATNTSNASSSSKPPSAKELQRKLKKEHLEKVRIIKDQKIAGLFANKWIKTFGKTAAIIVPVLIWIEEMATVNVLFDEGYIDGKQAQNYRAAYSGVCFTAMITNWAAFILVAKTSGTIVTGLRTALLGMPGPGWIAWVVTSLAQAAFFAFLNREATQNYVCKLIMTQAWPAADWVGSMGELGAVDWADKVKDELKDAAKEPGALGARGNTRTQQTTPSQSATGNQPANTPAAPSSGQAAQPSVPGGQSVTGADLMKSIGL